jgi:hypothetical protein
MSYDPNFDSDFQAGSAEVSALLRQARQQSFRVGESAARPLYDQALSLAKANSDMLGRGNALKGIGFSDAMAGRHNEARLAYLEALSLFRQGGYRVQEAFLLNALGHLEKGGDARRYFEQAADAFHALGLSLQEQMARGALR